jgi:hypothetical protein
VHPLHACWFKPLGCLLTYKLGHVWLCAADSVHACLRICNMREASLAATLEALRQGRDRDVGVSDTADSDNSSEEDASSIQ